MSVASVAEIQDGRDGGITLSLDGKTVRQYTRVFRAITTSNYDNAATILSDYRFPIVGAYYPNDVLAFCRSIRPRQMARSKLIWIVTATYSTERQIVENPLADPAEISWATESRTRPYFQDRSGDAILNAAGFYFDPPIEGDDSRWVATVKKNLGGVPSWILSYRDAINNAVTYIDGVTVQAYKAKLSNVTIGKWEERNNILYRPLTMKIALNNDTWRRQTLNDGFYELASPGADPTPVLDTNGDPVTSPWPLDAAGKMIAKPTPANAIFITSQLYQEKDFSVLPLT
jgi:hypothetical protein